MHIPDVLIGKMATRTNSANRVPLFHVVTFHDHLRGKSDDAKYRREARIGEISRKVQEILDNGFFDNACGTLCKNGEERGFYLFFGHLYPLIDDSIVPPLKLLDFTCFLMIRVECFVGLNELSGSPFDTGEWLRVNRNSVNMLSVFGQKSDNGTVS